VRLIELAKARGFRWFNLGMAPFSGLEEHALAPLWHKLGGALFRHGEALYRFQGLRQYKEKFDPVWRPRYLAAPSGIALPIVLKNVAALVNRGPEGTA
jgi:phosphatidylglycerol lysyltransferase